METVDHYKVLNVSPTATEQEIKHAYRSLVRRYHPDHHKNDSVASQKMSQLNVARDVLLNPISRRNFDQKREESFEARQTPKDAQARGNVDPMSRSADGSRGSSRATASPPPAPDWSGQQASSSASNTAGSASATPPPTVTHLVRTVWEGTVSFFYFFAAALLPVVGGLIGCIVGFVTGILLMFAGFFISIPTILAVEIVGKSPDPVLLAWALLVAFIGNVRGACFGVYLARAITPARSVAQFAWCFAAGIIFLGMMYCFNEAQEAFAQW